MVNFDRRSVVIGGVASWASGSCIAGSAWAADDWKAQWDRTIAAAKREGAVTISASSNASRRAFIVGEWSKAFPEITISYQVVNGTRFVPQVVTERRAGKYIWDVWHSGPPSGLEAFKAGLLDPLLPELILPEVTDTNAWDDWESVWYDPERRYLLGLFDDITAPYFNAKLLDPARVEALGLKILLEPDLKGKIFWLDPRVSGPGGPYLILIDRVLGADALRKILTEQDPVFVSSESDVATAIVRGRGLVGLGNRAGEVMGQFVNAGLDVDVRPFGNRPEVGWRGTGGATVGLFNRRPHPNAARLFANWIATREIGVGLSKAQDLNSARRDVPPLDPRYSALPGLKYVDGQRLESLDVMHQWQNELKKLRPR